MKPLASTPHGYLDYVTVAIFLVSPTLLGLAGSEAIVAYVLAGVHALMTLITDFPPGAIKVVPLPYHGWVERIVGPALIVLPFAAGFTTPGHVFYITMGIVIVLVGLLSNYQGAAR